jgi:hypothetical protein
MDDPDGGMTDELGIERTFPHAPGASFLAGLQEFGRAGRQNFVFADRHEMGHADQLLGLTTEVVTSVTVR